MILMSSGRASCPAALAPWGDADPAAPVSGDATALGAIEPPRCGRLRKLPIAVAAEPEALKPLHRTLQLQVEVHEVLQAGSPLFKRQFLLERRASRSQPNPGAEFRFERAKELLLGTGCQDGPNHRRKRAFVHSASMPTTKLRLQHSLRNHVPLRGLGLGLQAGCTGLPIPAAHAGGPRTHAAQARVVAGLA